MPRRKETSKRPVIDVAGSEWILKNFLVAEEKRTLVKLYHNKIEQALTDNKDEFDHLDSELEYLLKTYAQRIDFIVKHF